MLGLSFLPEYMQMDMSAFLSFSESPKYIIFPSFWFTL